VRSHLVPQRLRLLPARRRRRKDDHVYFHRWNSPCRKSASVYFHPAGASRVPAAGVEDPATHVDHNSTHRQVPAVHVHHEHRDDPHNGHHHQLELQDAAHPPHARLGKSRLS